MRPKELFISIFAVLFRYRSFWQKLKDNMPSDTSGLLRDYAVPVIALTQLCKFPLIGVPRPAMFFSIATFLIDVGVLYLLIGGAVYLVDPERPEKIQSDMLTVFSYSMTPVWISELFYFTGVWSWLFAVSAILYTVVISRYGFNLLCEPHTADSRNALRKITLFQVAVNCAVFFLEKALMRLFNFI